MMAQCPRIRMFRLGLKRKPRARVTRAAGRQTPRPVDRYLKQAAAAAQLSFTKSPAFDTNATRGYTFRAIGLLVEGERVRAARANKNK